MNASHVAGCFWNHMTVCWRGLEDSWDSWNEEDQRTPALSRDQTPGAEAIYPPTHIHPPPLHPPALQTSDKRSVTRRFWSVVHVWNWVFLDFSVFSSRPDDVTSMWGSNKQGENQFHSADGGKPAGVGGGTFTHKDVIGGDLGQLVTLRAGLLFSDWSCQQRGWR